MVLPLQLQTTNPFIVCDCCTDCCLSFRAHRLLAWLPPPLLLHLQSLLGFLHACWELLPQFISPGFREALRRLVLVLGASLLMIVVVSTIDSAWLYLYLLNARQIATAA